MPAPAVLAQRKCPLRQARQKRAPDRDEFVIEVELWTVQPDIPTAAQMNVGAGATLEHVGEVLAAKAGPRGGDNLVFPQQFGGNLSGEPRLLRRVDGHRQNAVVLDRRGRAETGRSATDAVPQATLNQ